MTDKHPITPPPELVHQWADMLASGSGQAVFAMAARWGADQELEAICDWLDHGQTGHLIHPLLCARRPKPLSLKEQALEALDDVAYDLGAPLNYVVHEQINTIRRALEDLDD